MSGKVGDHPWASRAVSAFLRCMNSGAPEGGRTGLGMSGAAPMATASSSSSSSPSPSAAAEPGPAEAGAGSTSLEEAIRPPPPARAATDSGSRAAGRRRPRTLALSAGAASLLVHAILQAAGRGAAAVRWGARAAQSLEAAAEAAEAEGTCSARRTARRHDSGARASIAVKAMTKWGGI